MAEAWMTYGYWGLFVAAFLAATVLPFSSDVVLGTMIVAGYDPVWAWMAAIAGNWLGGMVSYGMGYLGKWEWVVKYLRADRNKVERFMVKAKKYGPTFALVTWLPIIGDPMAIALGFVRSPLGLTAWWMFVGKGLRYLAIIILVQQGEAWWLGLSE